MARFADESSLSPPLHHHLLRARSQMYIKELWGLNPINPATTDIKLLSVGARSEQSSTLALNSCLLMSSGTSAARALKTHMEAPG